MQLLPNASYWQVHYRGLPFDIYVYVLYYASFPRSTTGRKRRRPYLVKYPNAQVTDIRIIAEFSAFEIRIDPAYPWLIDCRYTLTLLNIAVCYRI